MVDGRDDHIEGRVCMVTPDEFQQGRFHEFDKPAIITATPDFEFAWRESLDHAMCIGRGVATLICMPAEPSMTEADAKASCCLQPQ